MPCRICLRKNMKVYYRINIDFIDLMEKLSEIKMQVTDAVCCFCLATLRRIQNFMNTAKKVDSISKQSIKTEDEEDEMFTNKLYNYTVTAREHMSIKYPWFPCRNNNSDVGDEPLIEIKRDPVMEDVKENVYDNERHNHSEEPCQSTENMNGNKIDNQPDSEDDVQLASIADNQRENEPPWNDPMDTDSPEELTPPTSPQGYMDFTQSNYGRLQNYYNEAKYRRDNSMTPSSPPTPPKKPCFYSWSIDRKKSLKLRSAELRCRVAQQKAARKYKIPESILRNHLKKSMKAIKCCGKKSSKQSILGVKQEEFLCALLKRFAENGVPLTKKFVREQAYVFFERYDVEHNFSKSKRLACRHWVEKFLKRNPSIAEITARKLHKRNTALPQMLTDPASAQSSTELTDPSSAQTSKHTDPAWAKTSTELTDSESEQTSAEFTDTESENTYSELTDSDSIQTSTEFTDPESAQTSTKLSDTDTHITDSLLTNDDIKTETISSCLSKEYEAKILTEPTYDIPEPNISSRNSPKENVETQASCGLSDHSKDVMPSTSVEKRRYSWSKNSLKAAVKKCRLAQRAAAAKYDIPRRILRRHLKNKDVQPDWMKPFSSAKQEQSLCTKLIGLAQNGVKITSELLVREAYQTCARYSLTDNFKVLARLHERDWVQNFLKRNPSITLSELQTTNRESPQSSPECPEDIMFDAIASYIWAKVEDIRPAEHISVMFDSPITSRQSIVTESSSELSD